MTLKQPKRIVQKSQNTCWAAALESWTGVTKPAATSQEGLIAVYAKLADGGLSLVGLATLANNYSLIFESAFLSPKAGAAQYPAQTVARFSALYVDDLLAKYGHLLVAYKLLGAGNWWHVVVLYGVAEGTFSMMDPKPRRGW